MNLPPYDYRKIKILTEVLAELDGDNPADGVKALNLLAAEWGVEKGEGLISGLARLALESGLEQVDGHLTELKQGARRIR